MKVNLRIWRQNGPGDKGSFQEFPNVEVTPAMSFLEMLDVVNVSLEAESKSVVAFDSDCREGICGMCGAVVNGIPHGMGQRSTLCQLHMRSFNDGDTITIEPFRAKAFPVIKDLMVDRSAFDRIIGAGGFVTARVGSAPDANAMPIGKDVADEAMDAATCIGCGACVAACPNASAMLFTSAKVSHLNMLPQGGAQKDARVLDMIAQHDEEGFGACRNYSECEAACPKGIGVNFIAKLNRDLRTAAMRAR